MEEVFNSLKAQIKECEEKKEMFRLPSIDGCEISEVENQPDGAILYSVDYCIKKGDEKIEINYKSKDKCRTFQINPDRSVINIRWTKADGSVEKIDDAWDER